MSSLYGMLVKLIEQRIGPLAGKLGQQRYVLAIRDGFIAALPFMIVGSFMPVSYTHLDVYKRQVCNWIVAPESTPGLLAPRKVTARASCWRR